MKLSNFEFTVPWNSVRGYCDLEMYIIGTTRQKSTLVIFTETAANPGPSVTNAAEHIAGEVVIKFDLDPARCLWVEHYPPRGRVRPEDTYDLVTFVWHGRTASKPDWRRVSTDWVSELL